jgi:hypothetical protein
VELHEVEQEASEIRMEINIVNRNIFQLNEACNHKEMYTGLVENIPT